MTDQVRDQVNPDPGNAFPHFVELTPNSGR